jgi:CspA family cold shock protein
LAPEVDWVERSVLPLVAVVASSQHGDMGRSGRATGTVSKWLADEGWGVIHCPSGPGDCWTDRSAIEVPEDGLLRPGQPVEVEWQEPGQHGYPFRAKGVRALDDLETTPGG